MKIRAGAEFESFFVGQFQNLQKSWASAMVLFFACINFAFSVENSRESELSVDAVVKEAVSQNLHEHRYWQKLLHIKGGDGGPFTDDKSETVLIDTLKAFAQPLLKSSEADTHAQCLFPARLAWLDEKLHLFQRGLKKTSCPRLQQWKTSLYPDSVSVVFASYYLSNPASMFGHTLLRLNQRQHKGIGLLDYGVNYAANVTTKNPLLYAVFGIAGGFNGQFASFPYYMKVLEYGHLESRDLWEYELNLSSAEVNRLMDHLWEIRMVPLDYYFFSKNCSYYMLELLEVARPSLQILDSHRPWVIPADTVRWLAAEPDLIKEIHFRPSAINLLHERQKHMNSAQKRVLFSVLDNLTDKHFVQNIDGFASDLPSSKEKAFVWEAVIDYLLHIKNTRAEKLDEHEQWTLDESLRLRSRIPNSEGFESAIDKSETPVPLHLSPHQAHRSFRLTSRVGWGEVGGEYFQFEVHPAFHDLMAYDAGYPPYSQIEVMGLHGRFYFGLTESRKAVFKIQKFSLLEVMSLNPYESLFPKASWKGGIVMDQLPAARKDDRSGDCHGTVFGCERLRTNVGYGISKLMAEKGAVMAFGFLQWELAFSNAFRPHFRVAPGAHVGILFDPAQHWRVMLSSQFTKGVWGDGRITDQSSVQIRWRLKQNVDLRAEYHEYRVDREASFGMSLFL